ncbi:X8-like protein [Cynara cardunculus var. scolymus]|uniref:X8-like protein n=1 Tax=Cynara cardunculus var. scolymus TaxID=59895 RepID=A0A103YAE9_CYNCS|nr:X8-like protein [Cynara cardunculus var. scolymus]
MALFALSMVVLSAMAGYSSADYCVCNSGLSDAVLQKNIDYACGNGADCTQILQNGACYNPNTVKDHCNYAVNSYYQRKSQGPGTCATSACYAGNPRVDLVVKVDIMGLSCYDVWWGWILL